MILNENRCRFEGAQESLGLSRKTKAVNMNDVRGKSRYALEETGREWRGHRTESSDGAREDATPARFGYEVVDYRWTLEGPVHMGGLNDGDIAACVGGGFGGGTQASPGPEELLGTAALGIQKNTDLHHSHREFQVAAMVRLDRRSSRTCSDGRCDCRTSF